MSRLRLENVSKRYGDFAAVDNVTLDVAEGELVVLLGPSGCGKTTTLRMIAGFIDPTGGRVRLGERDITELPPWRRNAGLVFQGYALFPHLTVFDNVAFGLRMRKVPEAEVGPAVADALRLVRLDGFGERMPRALSGGQQQRVALARALVIKPEILLLDEPLSNLDAKLRQEVRVEIRQLQRALGLTTVLVTHDQEEAMTMGDRLVVMRDGHIQQIGTQRDLYDRPANRFVAGFIGRSNFLDGRMDGPGRFVTPGGLSVAVAGAAPDGACVLALRPERIMLTDDAAAATNAVSGIVRFVTYLGALSEYLVRLDTGEELVVHEQSERTAGGRARAVGDAVRVAWPAEAGLLVADARSTD
jgi:putative spermidine/putrescine transport system ATP-binding protein